MSGDREAVLARLKAGPRTVQRLDMLVALLRKWSPKINLVAPSTLPEVWTRHVLDSGQVFDLAPEGTRDWADLGSGGGFPGLVVAILAAERTPQMQVTLVESDQRKAAFLRTVSRETSVSVTVLAERAEALPCLYADVVSARALAPLPKLLELAEQHLKPGGVALFPKGATHRDELRDALAMWSFTVQNHPSESHPDAALLRIGDIARV